MTALIRYAALAIALGTCHPGAGAAAASFDGCWAVEVLSEDGGCSGVYVLPIEVVHSRIFYIGRAEIDVDGAIDAAGKVRARSFNGAELVDAGGELEAKTSATAVGCHRPTNALGLDRSSARTIVR